MNRITFTLLGLMCFCSSWAQSYNLSKIENQLRCADSLFSLKLYDDVIKQLEPIEPNIQINDDLNVKLNYYTILSMSYFYKSDIAKCVYYSNKSASYNQSDLDDLIFAANLSITELQDYNETKKYSRKALIKYYGNSALEHNVSIEDIGRLLYLLGKSYINSNDLFMAKECLKKHSSLNIETQNEINLDLANHLCNIELDKSNTEYHHKELINIPDLSLPTQRHSVNRHDSIQCIQAISSCKTITLENIENYLDNVLSLDSIYGLNQEIYLSKRLLDTAIQNINAAKIGLSSHRGIQLMFRLGRIYSLFNDNNEALEWLFMAKDICNYIGVYDEVYFNTLKLIANIYIYKDIFWSRLFIEEAIEIYENLYGSILEQNSDEAYPLLINYASILEECKQYDIAENIYRHILKFSQEPTSILYALNNYGTMLSKQGEDYEAIHYYTQLNHLYPYIDCLTNLISAYINTNNLQKAESHLKAYVTSMFETIVNSWSTFTEYEIEEWLDKSASEFYMSSNYLAHKINSHKSLEYGYDATLFCKIFPMLFKATVNKCINKKRDKNLQNLNNEFKKYKDKIIKSNDSQADKGYLLHLALQHIEDSIKNKITDLPTQIMKNSITYRDVVKKLEKDEAAIEFFEYLDLSSEDVRISYAAYIIFPDNEAPLMVQLSPFQTINSIVLDMLKDETTLNSTYCESTNYIYNEIWNKLITYLSDKRTIYYSTSGALSFINHDILIDNSGAMLSELYNLRRVSSTSQIEQIKKNVIKEYSTAALYGNIDYDSSPNLMSEACNNESHPFSKPSHITIPSANDRSGWTNLLYSKQEITGILSVMNSIGINTTTFEKNNANEESFKALDSMSPDIIHLATHGFSSYKLRTSNNKYHTSYTSNDQLLSFEGLLLSGANNTWLGKQIPENNEDGILTAQEISNLDLSGTKLVVLSACNTGKGSLNLTGRVIGLGEAFKMAGAKSILMSLWEVPDESTALLMTKFYEALFSGNNRHEALKIAMKKVREIYPDPYYWGAFVILD